MRRRILIVSGVLASLVLVGGLVYAKSRQQPLVREAVTFTVIEHADSDAVTDTGPGGDSVGDLLTWNNKLFNRANTKVVGHDQGVCVRVNTTKGRWDCNWTNNLEGGQIMVQGPFLDTRDNTIAVVGGTGKYANARGTMDVKARKGGTEYAFVFHLIP